MAHVLLIEPDYVLAKTYKAALKHAGYDVISAQDAQKAIHLCDSVMPDVVIVELQLVEHNGAEFLYEFRSYQEWNQIPIIIHTLTPPSTIQIPQDMFKRLSVVAYLYKPTTSLSKLIRQVSATIGQINETSGKTIGINRS